MINTKRGTKLITANNKKVESAFSCFRPLTTKSTTTTKRLRTESMRNYVEILISPHDHIDNVDLPDEKQPINNQSFKPRKQRKVQRCLTDQFDMSTALDEIHAFEVMSMWNLCGCKENRLMPC